MKRETSDPIPSWNDGKAKQSIEAFVHRVATAGGKELSGVPGRCNRPEISGARRPAGGSVCSVFREQTVLLSPPVFY